MADQGKFHPTGNHLEGSKDMDCLDDQEPVDDVTDDATNEEPTDGGVDGSCSKYDTDGWHGGNRVAILYTDVSPSGVEWQWQECAAECVKNDACEFWTLRKNGNKACILKKHKGTYSDTGGHMEGARDEDCLGDHNDDGICSKYEETGWHSGTYLEKLPSYQAPNGYSWSYQDCAAECAKFDACEFWTLKLKNNGACLLMADQGKFHPTGNHL